MDFKQGTCYFPWLQTDGNYKVTSIKEHFLTGVLHSLNGRFIYMAISLIGISFLGLEFVFIYKEVFLHFLFSYI